MRINPPPEIIELREKRKPYMDGCYLRPDAPKEIVQIDKKIKDWYKDIFDRAFEACLL